MSRLGGLVCFLLLASAAHAQDASTGAIRGTVSDPNGGRVSGATVAVVNTATALRYFATTDSQGRFVFELLPPGDYLGRAESPSMSPQVTPPLHVEVGGTAELHFKLTVAEAKETLTVSGAPQLVETQPSGISSVLDERAINDLPLNGRRFTDLALLTPGVTQDPRPHLQFQRRPSLRWHSRLPVQLPGRRRRQQQRFLRSGPRTLSRSISIQQRSRAGVSRFFQHLWRRVGTRWRRRRQHRHQVRLQPFSRHQLLFSSRQRF